MIAKIVAEARMLTFRPVNFVNYSQKVSWSCASIFRYALVCSRLTRDRERALISDTRVSMLRSRCVELKKHLDINCARNRKKRHNTLQCTYHISTVLYYALPSDVWSLDYTYRPHKRLLDGAHTLVDTDRRKTRPYPV